MLAGEHPSGAAESDRDLVEDEQRSVTVAGGTHATPVIGRRNERSAPDGLADDRGDVTLLLEDVINVIGALEAAGGAAAERALQWFGGRDVFAPGEQGADALAEDGFAADGDGVEGSAVEGVPHRHKLEPAGGDAGELEGHANGGGSTGGEQDAVEVAGGEFGQALGERDRGFAGVTSGAEAEGVELVLDGFEDPGVAVADLMDVVAVEIEETTPLDVLDPRAFGLADGVEAGGGQGLVEERVGVFGEDRTGFSGKVLAGELLPAWRQIDVALGAECGEVVVCGRGGDGHGAKG